MHAKQYILEQYYYANEEFVKTVEVMLCNIKIQVSNGPYHLFAQYYPEFTQVNPKESEVKKFINDLMTFVYILDENEPACLSDERLKIHFDINTYCLNTIYFVYSYMILCVIPCDHPNKSLHDHLLVIFVVIKNALNEAILNCQRTYHNLYYPDYSMIRTVNNNNCSIVNMRIVAKERSLFLMPKEILEYSQSIIDPDTFQAFSIGHGTGPVSTLDIFEYIFWKHRTGIFNDSMYDYYKIICEYLGSSVLTDKELFFTKMHNYLFARIDKFHVTDLCGTIMAEKII